MKTQTGVRKGLLVIPQRWRMNKTDMEIMMEEQNQEETKLQTHDTLYLIQEREKRTAASRLVGPGSDRWRRCRGTERRTTWKKPKLLTWIVVKHSVYLAKPAKVSVPFSLID